MSTPPNNNPPDPNDPATFTGNSGVSAAPTVPASANTGTTANPFGGWYSWNTATTVPSIASMPIIIIGSVAVSGEPTTPTPIEMPHQQKVKRGTVEGYECSACKSFSEFSELNMPEGSNDPTHYTCYSCRKGLNS